MGTLVLWDVDETLVDSRSYGVELDKEAFPRLFGRFVTRRVPTAGRTARAIYVDLLEAHGLDGADLVDDFAALVGEMAGERLVGGRALPGAVEAVAALGRHGGLVQSVLTGNLRAVAVAKLADVGLLGAMELRVGGFGDRHRDRGELARETVGGRGDVVLIGDTPLDIAAARACGARSVAVATGDHSVEELAGADVVLWDLTDTEALVRAVVEGRS